MEKDFRLAKTILDRIIERVEFECTSGVKTLIPIPRFANTVQQRTLIEYFRLKRVFVSTASRIAEENEMHIGTVLRIVRKFEEAGVIERRSVRQGTVTCTEFRFIGTPDVE